MGFYTQGNSRLSNAVAAPTGSGQSLPVLAQPKEVALTQQVPLSNYRTLRDTNNRFYISMSLWIDWGAGQIKINSNNSLLVNFLAGGGDDVMGGSVRSDNLYGEEGNDELQGQDGNDYLDGGIGQDRLFGGVSDDVLLGFTASNETKQSLNAGESDNDYLNGDAKTYTHCLPNSQNTPKPEQNSNYCKII